MMQHTKNVNSENILNNKIFSLYIVKKKYHRKKSHIKKREEHKKKILFLYIFFNSPHLRLLKDLKKETPIQDNGQENKEGRYRW